MRQATVVLLPLLLISASTLAQTGASAPTVYVAPPVSRSCPIGLYAQRRSGSQVIRIADVDPGAHPRPVPLGGALGLSFKPLESPDILAISGFAHGPSLSFQFENASTAHPEITTAYPGEISERFHLERSTSSGSLTRSELRTQTLTNIRWVELTGIDFADGSHWQASPESRCRATPNPYLLVTNSR